MADWPTSHLKAAERAFQLLVCPPVPLAFDCRGITGLPQAVLPLDELRDVLVNRSDPLPRAIADAVWRELVMRARRDGPAWKVAAVAMAMPGLVRLAGTLTRGWRGDTDDLDAEVLTGFLERLATVNLDDPRLVGKLIDAAERAAKRAREWADDGKTIRVDGAWSVPPPEPWDHPDWVLARAVVAGVVGAEEAILIGETRLGEVPLQVVADKLEVSVKVAAAWRRKAERALTTAIRSGGLSSVSLHTAVSRHRMLVDDQCLVRPAAT